MIIVHYLISSEHSFLLVGKHILYFYYLISILGFLLPLFSKFLQLFLNIIFSLFFCKSLKFSFVRTLLPLNPFLLYIPIFRIFIKLLFLLSHFCQKILNQPHISTCSLLFIYLFILFCEH